MGRVRDCVYRQCVGMRAASHIVHQRQHKGQTVGMIVSGRRVGSHIACQRVHMGHMGHMCRQPSRLISCWEGRRGGEECIRRAAHCRHAHPSAPEVGFLSADTGRRIPPRVFVSSSATRTSTRSPFGCSCRISEGLEDKGDGAVGASVTCAATQYRRHRGHLGTLV